MEYKKLNLRDGDVLKAEHIDHLEKGISDLASDSDVLIVNVMRHPDATLTADKTYEELYAAFGDGKILYANVDNEIYALMYCSVTAVKFGSLRRTGTGIYEYTLSVLSNDYVEEGETEISISYLDFPSAYRGNLIYVNTSGEAKPLRLGDGLAIVDGVLTMNNTVHVNVDADGNATLSI